MVANVYAVSQCSTKRVWRVGTTRGARQLTGGVENAPRMRDDEAATPLAEIEGKQTHEGAQGFRCGKEIWPVQCTGSALVKIGRPMNTRVKPYTRRMLCIQKD